VAVLLACVQDSDWGDGGLSGSAVAHHPGSRRATFGSVKPRRSSISANVRTTLSAYRSYRYLCKDRYSDVTADGCELGVVITVHLPKADDHGGSRFPASPQSCRTTLSSELLILRGFSPLYSMKPSFLNLFRKKFTRERVVPIISASVSWEILGTRRAGLSCFP
jgi:hypothetical protein